REIVERLVVPAQPDAVVRDSLVLSPAFPGYDRMVRENGSKEFADVDVEGAIALLEDAGVTNPSVCVLYDSGSGRRVSIFQLLEATATRAGFDIQDCGSSDWSELSE